MAASTCQSFIHIALPEDSMEHNNKWKNLRRGTVQDALSIDVM